MILIFVPIIGLITLVLIYIRHKVSEKTVINKTDKKDIREDKRSVIIPIDCSPAIRSTKGHKILKNIEYEDSLTEDKDWCEICQFYHGQSDSDSNHSDVTYFGIEDIIPLESSEH